MHREREREREEREAGGVLTRFGRGNGSRTNAQDVEVKTLQFRSFLLANKNGPMCDCTTEHNALFLFFSKGLTRVYDIMQSASLLTR